MHEPLMVDEGGGDGGGGAEKRGNPVARWWHGTPAGERALHVALALALLSYAALLAVQVGTSYQEPEVRIEVQKQSAMRMPVMLVCPFFEGNVSASEVRVVAVLTESESEGNTGKRLFNATRRLSPPPPPPLPAGCPAAAQDAPDPPCFLFDQQPLLRRSKAYVGSKTISVVLYPREPLLNVLMLLRYSDIESVEYHCDDSDDDDGGDANNSSCERRVAPSCAPGQDGIFRAEPADEGEVVVAVPFISASVVGTGGSERLASLWSVAMSSTREYATDGSLTQELIGVEPVQLLLRGAHSEDPLESVPDIYMRFDRLEVTNRHAYVRLNWLYFVGALGGAVSIIKLVLFLVRARRSVSGAPA